MPTDVALFGSTNFILNAAVTSSHRAGRYAQYFRISVPTGSVVTIQMDETTSPSVDTYLYLLSGSSESSAVLLEDDDSGGSSQSRISTTLYPGQYVAECTTYDPATIATGTFTTSGTIIYSPVTSSYQAYRGQTMTFDQGYNLWIESGNTEKGSDLSFLVDWDRVPGNNYRMRALWKVANDIADPPVTGTLRYGTIPTWVGGGSQRDSVAGFFVNSGSCEQGQFCQLVTPWFVKPSSSFVGNVQLNFQTGGTGLYSVGPRAISIETDQLSRQVMLVDMDSRLPNNNRLVEEILTPLNTETLSTKHPIDFSKISGSSLQFVLTFRQKMSPVQASSALVFRLRLSNNPMDAAGNLVCFSSCSLINTSENYFSVSGTIANPSSASFVKLTHEKVGASSSYLGETFGYTIMILGG